MIAGLLAVLALGQQATLLAAPERARIGEPLTWTLVVEHDVDERVVLEDDAVPPDDSWVLLDGPTRVRVRDGERAFTRLEWQVFSLEPGTRALPSLALGLSSGLELEALAGAVEIEGELAPDEDAPRPTLEPLEAPADAESSSLSGLGLPLGVAAALLLLATLLLRRRRADAAGQETPAEPLPSLRALLEAGASAEALAATLSTRLRTSVDGLQGSARPGLLDGEWVAAVRSSGGAAAAEADTLERLLAWADRVEFAAERPSRFALEEAATEADLLLEGPLAPQGAGGAL